MNAGTEAKENEIFETQNTNSKITTIGEQPFENIKIHNSIWINSFSITQIKTEIYTKPYLKFDDLSLISSPSLHWWNTIYIRTNGTHFKHKEQ